MDSLILILLAFILIVAVAMLAGLGRLGRTSSRLDRDYFAKKWQTIEKYKGVGNSQMAILEADKLLDYALKTLAYGGETMGERLKDAKAALRNNDAVWSAHKLRNRIAHDQNVVLNGIAVDKALRSIKGALKDLGAL